MTLTPEATVGLIALFGIVMIAILMMLKKFGIIKFAGGSHCPDHDFFCDSFKKLKDEHIIQGEAIKQHEKQLEEGRTDFAEIKKDISEIKADVKLIMFKLEIR